MILTYLCFVPNSLGPSDVARLLGAHDLGFKPTRLSTNRFGRSGGVQFTPKALDRLGSLPEIGLVRVEGEGGSLGLTGLGVPGQAVVWETAAVPSVGLIEAASVLPGFTAALVGDADDVFWQSADQVNTYQVFDRAWEHLPKVWDEVFERDKIDVSANPGRAVAVPCLWLWAAARMWFGPDAWSIVDRDKLLSLPVGKVAARADGVVQVELFDLGDPVDVIRSRQQEFRDWVDFDGIESRVDELMSMFSDPKVELEIGSFEHGGVRLVIEWMDGDRLVSRSRASTRRLTELDQDGSVVFRDITSAGGAPPDAEGRRSGDTPG